MCLLEVIITLSKCNMGSNFCWFLQFVYSISLFPRYSEEKQNGQQMQTGKVSINLLPNGHNFRQLFTKQIQSFKPYHGLGVVFRSINFIFRFRFSKFLFPIQKVSNSPVKTFHFTIFKISSLSSFLFSIRKFLCSLNSKFF